MNTIYYIERCTKGNKQIDQESFNNSVKNGFFGNIIVPMKRVDEMSFLCKPMKTKNEVNYMKSLIFLEFYFSL